MKIDQKTNSLLSHSFIKMERAKKEETENTIIYAGNLKVNENPIAQKRKQAQAKALKVVGGALKNDRKIDDDLQKRRDCRNKYYENIESASQEIGKIEKNKQELKKSYGIEDDSEEQKNLELLEKRRESFDIYSQVSLSDEEKVRLSEIDKAGMTEYQTRSLQLDAKGGIHQKEIREAKKGIIEENAIIRGIQLERLKSSPMVDAVKEADSMLDAASEEITGMLLDEAKEHIDDKAKEKQEETEKKAEKKEKQEEQLEVIKEKRKELEELINPEKVEEEENDGFNRTVNNDIAFYHFLEITHNESDIKREVENIVDKMKLVADDIKGAVVDSKL